MKATEAKLLDFLKKAPQLIIPIYQRTYGWGERECRQLWDDIVRCGSSDTIPVHFIGSIVYISAGLGTVIHQSPLLIIDGQQRLATISLLLAAISEIIGTSEPYTGFSKRRIRNYYLVNPEEEGERHPKLLLSQTDRDSLIAIVTQRPSPLQPSVQIHANYALFAQWLADSKTDLAVICRGLAKLVIVDIALTRDQDNPQLIFESMNATGKELSQADLIRNFVLMGLEPAIQTRLYHDYWRPIEHDFGQAAYSIHFDAFMRYYLTVKTGEVTAMDAVYDAFKAYIRNMHHVDGNDQPQIIALVQDVRAYAHYYWALALGNEPNPQLNEAFADLRELKIDAVYPLLMTLYHDYQNSLLGLGEFFVCLRLLESYLFRRSVCGIPSNSVSNTFITLAQRIDSTRYSESLQALLVMLPSYRRFPSDDEFEHELQHRDLYNFRQRNYLLRRLENHRRQERISLAEYTVEHVLPQNPQLSAAWREALGSDWQHVQQRVVHTLGNLTLTRYNSEFRDRSFVDKRDMPSAPEKGLRFSPLHLNADFAQLDTWNETMILQRAARLAARAVTIWQSPALAQAVVDQYRTQRPSTAYTINDHPALLTATLYPVFDALRKAVLAVDPCMSEEFRKLYVAYKAEKTVMDVIALSTTLKITLHAPHDTLYDPLQRCRPSSDQQESQLILASSDDITYTVELVRQVLEMQINGA
jgi:uncharacterized protein with ParB-like and HNH nuclease domain/predicted transport protein